MNPPRTRLAPGRGWVSPQQPSAPLPDQPAVAPGSAASAMQGPAAPAARGQVASPAARGQVASPAAGRPGPVANPGRSGCAAPLQAQGGAAGPAVPAHPGAAAAPEARPGPTMPGVDISVIDSDTVFDRLFGPQAQEPRPTLF